MPPKHLSFSARDDFSRVLASLRQSFNLGRTTPSRSVQHEGPAKTPRGVQALAGQLQSLPPEVDLSFVNNPSTSPEHLVDAVQLLKPHLPIGCQLFGQGDMKIVGPFPIDAGGFADIWVGEMSDETVVAVKSYRYYSLSSHLPIYSRLYKEASACTSLTGNENVVPFIGLYSTCDHPFALIFEFMDHLNLNEYLRNNRDIGRMGLLLEIARGLRCMHALGIVHGNLNIANILVDGGGHARIGGLGRASTLCSMPAVDTDPSFHGAAPELIDPLQWGSGGHGATMASDVYAFAVLAWEVFAGRIPFSGENVAMAVNSMLNGRRPKRPSHPELSNCIWKLIEGCWKNDPTERKTMAEVVTTLEEEIGRHKSK